LKTATSRTQRRTQRRRESSPPRASLVVPRPLILLLLALVLVFAALIRIRMLGYPLERDEGEYAYAGQLILQGVPPYQLAYNMKLPGIYAAYALILAVFGQSPGGIHWGLLLVNAGAIVLVFALARRLFGPVAGIAAAATYALLSASQSVLGTAAHATHFVVLPALAGLLLLLQADETRALWAYFWSGVLLGVAFLMKQHGAVFVLFGFAFLFSRLLRRGPEPSTGHLARTFLFCAGVILPVGVTCILLLRAGVFDKFWFWTFSYARQYAAEASPADGWRNLGFELPHVLAYSKPLWALAGVGLLAAWSRKEQRARALYVTGFLVASVLGVCPGLYFRGHYFILLLPAIAILAGAPVGLAMRFLIEKRSPAALCYVLPALLFAIPWGRCLARQAEVFFELAPAQVCKLTYGANPFVEAPAIARYIAAHSGSDERVAILGSEPEIYFYSRRRSASGHIYMYGLMEKQPYAKRMQQEMIREIEAARPTFLLVVAIPTSWLAREESEKLLFHWYPRYLAEHYRLTGLIDIPQSGEAVYRWDDEAATYSPRSPYVVYVHRRKA